MKERSVENISPVMRDTNVNKKFKYENYSAVCQQHKINRRSMLP